MASHDELLDFAMLMVDSATRKYLDGITEMAFFLVITGIGKYRLESYPGAGHNFYIVLEAIYKYYRENPGKNVDKILFNTFMLYINAMSALNALSLICNYIVAQVKNEKQGISPFKLDNIQLLKQMKSSVSYRPEFSNDELAITLLNDTIRICEETMGEKVL